ncbi:1-phosphofructokinase [Propionimicrobium sp. PCR01-08-3]|uniref:1-phosphofructokinase family hexose kinase n=1 Tax=Propionimicrobium sp. PCR01-08-3 TaxID=3052086 RepID=UPI00255CCF37|nr:1-phosphofructokinase [Propionimicrobium sp. PCR01-08-3]WIY82279.1 1-phosphofructokinase [Propionimicrobium sp. PCR01-08-3]
MTEPQPAPLVVTFTANPSLDRTIALDDELLRGEVQRAVSITEQAAGKGINVARVVAASGRPVLAVCAGLDEQFSMLAARAAEPLPIRGIQLAPGQHVRGNTTVTEPSGVTTKLNGPGPRLTAQQVAEASLLLMDAAEGANWVALSGSLPPGAPVDWYARLVDGLHDTGAKIAVDTSDASLDAVLAGLPKGSFDLIKPNSDELAQLTGGDAAAFEQQAKTGQLDEIVAAAAGLHARGIANVLVTLGGSGAVLVNAEGAWYASAPKITVASTVGAGDSSVAGFILADVAGKSASECLASAIGYGSAAASLPGTTLPRPDDLPAGEVVCTRLR